METTDREDRTLLAWYRFLYAPRTEGRMTVTIGWRELLAVLGGAAAAAWPLAARAQQAAMPVVGLLGSTMVQGYTTQLAAFRQGLSETGFVEGRDVAIEYRWAEDQYGRLPALAADLVRRQVAVIATMGGIAAALAAKAATSTIPIVFHGSLDAIKAGFVTSLNRPGGNMTGVVTLNVDTGPKRLELMHELLPTATTIGLLLNPSNPTVTETQSKDLLIAAHTLGLQLHILHASTEPDFDTAFTSLIQSRAGGLVIGSDGFFVSQSERLAALAVRHAVPAIFQYRTFAEAGGLASYGGSITDYRVSGAYTGRILKGEKPADLPVQQATKVELIINLKTARALGLTIPPMVLARADEVIE
jgi:putative ABC transport system substrate-binding protein